MTIRLRPRERRGRFDSMVYSLDGRSAYPIEVGESLVIRKAPETLSLVHLRKQNFGALLRAKLRWQGRKSPRTMNRPLRKPGLRRAVPSLRNSCIRERFPIYRSALAQGR